jgi:hypothetical protein
MDIMFVLITIYSINYAVFTFLNGYNSASMGNVVFISLYPPTFYLLGKYLARSKTAEEIIPFLFLLITLIAIPVIVDVINDIQANQFINIHRTIEREDGTQAASATCLGLRVSLAVASVGLLFGKCNSKYEKIALTPFLVVAGLGITCVLHLINRTGVVLIAVSVLITFLFNVRHFSRKTILMMVLVMLILTLFYIPQLQFVTEVSDAYAVRNEGGNISTGGGRTQLWEYGLNNILHYPFGVPRSERVHYAHNYWLDTNMTGGIIALLFLLFITIRHLRNSWQTIRNMQAGLLRNLFITINIGFFLTALVEPIMEGFMVYVFLLFMFLGIVQQYKNMISTN